VCPRPPLDTSLKKTDPDPNLGVLLRKRSPIMDLAKRRKGVLGKAFKGAKKERRESASRGECRSKLQPKGHHRGWVPI